MSDLISTLPLSISSKRTLRSEAQAIGAIVRKELTIFLRYPSWFMSLLIWPVLFPFGYIFLATAMGGSASSDFVALTGTDDYISYIVIGSVLWMWLNMTLWTVGQRLRDEQMRGTLESNWLCPMWRPAMLLGASLADLGTSLVMLMVAVIEFRLFFGINLLSGNLWLLLLALILATLSVYGIGIIFASLVLRFKEANALVFIVRGIFMIFCGMSFPIAVLPGWMQQVAAWLPLTYAVHAFRAIILNDAGLAVVAPDLLALLGFAIVLPMVGFAFFSFVERGARRSGTLGHF